MTVEMIIAGKWYGFPVFVKTPAYIYFIVNYMVSLGYLTLGMMLSTLANNMNQSFTITFCVILLSMVMNILFAEPTVIKKIFFNTDVPDWVNIVNKIFYLVPGFQFSKLFMDITTITCFHFDSEHVSWVKSVKDFEYEDMFKRKTGTFITKDHYDVETMFDTLVTLTGIIFMYGWLAWYLDNVIPSNRGVAKPLSFFIWPSFWFPSIFGQPDFAEEEVEFKEQKNYINERDLILKLEKE